VTAATPGNVPRVHASNLFERLFEFSPDAVLVTNLAGSIIATNAQAERMFGYDRQELIGQPVEILIPERFRRIHPQHRSDYTAQPHMRPMGVGLDLYARRKDGSEFPVDILLSPVETSEGQVVLSIVRDISEKKQSEEALRRSELQWRSLFEFSPDAIIASDGEGKISEVNGQVERFFGYDRSELLGQPVEILIPDRFRQIHPRHRNDYSHQPRLRPMGAGLELYGRRKDGSEFPVDIMLGQVEAAEGRVVLSVIRDLTEKKESEEALRRSEQEKRYLEEEIITTHQFEAIVGENPGLKRVMKQVENVAATDATVLILGETGTGKELIARAIRQAQLLGYSCRTSRKRIVRP